MGKPQRAIYSADTWHVDDGVGTDGGPPSNKPLGSILRQAGLS